MTEELVCSGCGAAIQTEDQNKAGILRNQRWKKTLLYASAVFVCAITMKYRMWN